MSKLSLVKVFFALLLVFITTTAKTHAFTPVGFTNESDFYIPEFSSESFISFDGEYQRLILKPSVRTSASKFGMLVPVPNKPKVSRSSEQIFIDLENLTAGAESSLKQTQDDYPRYTIEIIKPDNNTAIYEWLSENDFLYDENDVENLKYYIDNDFYFVALKVSRQDAYSGILITEPLEIKYMTAKPTLPLKSIATYSNAMNINLYVLADTSYFFPGTNITYSQSLAEINTDTYSDLKKFDLTDKWLTKLDIELEPSRIIEDLYLQKGTNEITLENSKVPVTVNVEDHNMDSGVVASKDGQELIVEPKQTNLTQETEPAKKKNLPLKTFVTLFLIVAAITILFGIYGAKKLTVEKSPKEQDNYTKTKLTLKDFFNNNSIMGAVLSVIFLLLILGAALPIAQTFGDTLNANAISNLLLIVFFISTILLSIFIPGIIVFTHKGWKSMVGTFVIQTVMILLLIVAISITNNTNKITNIYMPTETEGLPTPMPVITP